MSLFYTCPLNDPLVVGFYDFSKSLFVITFSGIYLLVPEFFADLPMYLIIAPPLAISSLILPTPLCSTKFAAPSIACDIALLFERPCIL